LHRFRTIKKVCRTDRRTDKRAGHG